MDIILLASGNSTRFGANKLLHSYQNKPLFAYTIDTLESLIKEEEIPIDHVIVVTKYKEIKEYIESSSSFSSIHNDFTKKGISYSIYLGIYKALLQDGYIHTRWDLEQKEWNEEEVKRSKKAYCFMVCDQPHLKLETLKQFFLNYQLSKKGIGCLSWKREWGNPVVFSHAYLLDLLRLDGDRGGKRIARENKLDVFTYEVQEKKELEDIDYQAREIE